MKKFTVMILCVSTFFVGLGGLVESVGASFKSDERALEIMRLARQAIGGEQNIKAMQALTIKGKASKTFEFDNISRVEQGDWELNLQLPNKMSKSLKIETDNKIGGGEKNVVAGKQIDVVVVRKGGEVVTEDVRGESPQKVVIVKKDEGGNVVTENVVGTEITPRVVRGERINAEDFHKNELFRTMLSLFLTTPNGTDAEFKFVGEQNVDGTNCEVVQINSGASGIKLFINKSTHLPVMMSYTDAKPMIFTFTTKGDNTNETEMPKMVMNRAEVQMGEFQVKFTDYRTVNGVQLPHKWTQTIDGKTDETIEVSAYEFNPANIGEKFKDLPQKIMIVTEKQ
ncbi:MAG TPA: hypothetical protein PKE69_02260 [Pyrinomonadaceae bacterium]|nr:hypothetical protein [Pyrinomonadaceae bacterium]